MMYHEPQATRAGITAALLARENLHGSETCLEGEAGFYNAFTGNNRGELSYTFTPGDGGISGTTDIGQTVQDLGSRWELLHITPKIYPTAGYNFPVIDLTARACANNPIPLDEVESINMEMNWLETSYPSPAFPNQDALCPESVVLTTLSPTPGYTGTTHPFEVSWTPMRTTQRLTAQYLTCNVGNSNRTSKPCQLFTPHHHLY
ncbi:MAG: hypothetical protein CM1200mP27_05190 [Chloroflexota bacterium]|nr:MAG: hypothetical protein CM1200mP27_05190 [Chloroflexota bacterium]